MNRIVLILAFVLWPVSLWGQKPVIFRIVNAASYASGSAGGSIGTIFGANLAAATKAADTVPLPTSLAGTTVSSAGQAVHLLYVSPNQINFQWPSPNGNEPSGGSAVRGVVVTTPVGDSEPYVAGVEESHLGIFTMNGSGCGQGAVLNVSSNGDVSLNSQSNSVSPGQYIAAYATGLGLVYPQPPDGYPTPSTPLTNATGGVGGALYDFRLHSTPPYSTWAGRAPGLIGVDQFNVLIPAGVRAGCAVPLQLRTIDASISQPVTIAIREGGGPCVDPPEAGYGQITWERTVSTTAARASSGTETVTVSLQSAPGKQTPPTRVFSKGPLPESQVYLGPACPIPGYRSLDAGVVRVQGPGFGPISAATAPLQNGPVSGLKIYEAALPIGAIRPGEFTVSTTGGTDVETFTSSIDIGPGIQITTDLAGILLPCNERVTINWTGGEPTAWVTVSEVHHLGTFDDSFSWQARASDGTIVIEPRPSAPRTCSSNRYPVDLVVEVTPDPSEAQSFATAGLSLGGQHVWRYLYRFEAFREQ